MSDRKSPQLGTLRRRSVSLITALTFLVLAVTGVIAFIQPFSIDIIGLHALMGFVFILLIGLHVFNNSRPLTSYLRSKALWATLAITTALTALFWWQPAPVRTVLG
jgi:predicted MFS family arabinose efflux permease